MTGAPRQPVSILAPSLMGITRATSRPAYQAVPTHVGSAYNAEQQTSDVDETKSSESEPALTEQETRMLALYFCAIWSEC